MITAATTAPDEPNPRLAAALAYAVRGWPVLPLEPRGKRPLGSLVPHGVKGATTDAATIRGWWTREPDANVGIATGAAAGFDVLDVDGEEGAASLAELERKHGPLPTTPEALTGGGGRHVLFAHADGLRNAVRFAPGLDVRTDGGYVVAAPSVHPSGRIYTWEVTRDPVDTPLAPWPAWLVAPIAERPTLAAVPSAGGRCGPEAPIVEGGRNATLASLAGTMRKRGMAEDSIRAALLAENAARCRPPLTEAEVVRIAGSIAGYEPEATVDALLDAAGFADLPSPIPGDRFETILANLATHANKGSAVRRAALREEAARRLKAAGVRRPGAAVDAALGKRPADGGDDSEKQGQALELETPDPWPEPVDGAALLDALAAEFRRHAILPPHAAEALALWVLHTHTWQTAAEFSPRLGITGPTKRCGKSRVLEVLAGLVARGLSTENVTPAALFRAVEKYAPTLLVDEGDTFLREAEGLRGLLNAGQRKGGTVLRTVGEDFEPRTFSVFGPVAIAAIGELPDTVKDRSILVPMRRKAPGETVRRMRLAEFCTEALPLRRRAARWAADHEDALRGARPDLPAALDDRAADGWEPLLAIADAAGGPWPERARTAAVALSAGRAETDGSNGVLVLRDLRDLFEARRVDRLPSEDAAHALGAMEDRPWAEWGRTRRPLAPPALARLLKPFGIVPRSIRLPDGRTPKGYLRSDFEDAWDRYLTEVPESGRHAATSPDGPALDGAAPAATPPPCVGEEAGSAPAWDLACGGVAAGDTAPDALCRACGSADRWRSSLTGDLRCRRCHPPVPGAEAP